MIIVDYETFVRLPAGTIFAEYEPCDTVSDWCIKIEQGEDSKYGWTYLGEADIFPTIDPDEFLDSASRYGRFKAHFYNTDGAACDHLDHIYFVILEKEEIETMIKRLKWAMDGCIGDAPGESDDV